MDGIVYRVISDRGGVYGFMRVEFEGDRGGVYVFGSMFWHRASWC